jgi:hypothetical protein
VVPIERTRGSHLGPDDRAHVVAIARSMGQQFVHDEIFRRHDGNLQPGDVDEYGAGEGLRFEVGLRKEKIHLPKIFVGRSKDLDVAW